MIIGIHPDRIGQESYSDKWSEYLRAKGIEVRSLNLLAPDGIEQACQCNGVMWRWTHTPHYKQSAQRILYTLEHHLDIPVFPNSKTTWHYDEKTAQFYLLKALQAPTPKIWLFWDYEAALKWAKQATYPIVFKLSVGASATNVLKIDSEVKAIYWINRAFKRGLFPGNIKIKQEFLVSSITKAKALVRRCWDSTRYILTSDYPKLPTVWWKPEFGYVYFQEFLPNNSYDTRVTVIGDRAFGYRRLNRPGDFRASGSGNFLIEPSLIDPRCIEIAFRLSKKGSFQSMAYDFLFKDGEPVVSEISYTFVDWMVHACPGHWDINLNWSDGQMWPEEAQVEDFLVQLETRQDL